MTASCTLPAALPTTLRFLPVHDATTVWTSFEEPFAWFILQFSRTVWATTVLRLIIHLVAERAHLHTSHLLKLVMKVISFPASPPLCGSCRSSCRCGYRVHRGFGWYRAEVLWSSQMCLQYNRCVFCAPCCTNSFHLVMYSIYDITIRIYQMIHQKHTNLTMQ